MVNYSVSLKGYTLESFLKTARMQEFDVLLKAIQNMKTTCINLTYTYVLQDDMEIHKYTLLCDFLHQNNIQTLIISDVRPYFSEDMEICKIKVPKHIEDIYEYLIDNGINAYLRLNHPLCHYSLKFIERLIQEKHLIMQCAVKRGGGLFFSESLDLVLCNGLQSIVVGSFDKDFLTYNDMINYLIKTKEMMDKLTGYPTKECEACDLWAKCGGCCLLYWI